MATRLYLQSGGTAPISPAVASDWEEGSANLVRSTARTTKQSTALTTKSETFSFTTSGNKICFLQFISPQLDGAQTISGTGTLQVMMRGSQEVTLDNNHLRWVIRVVSSDGLTVRGSTNFFESAADFSPASTLVARTNSNTCTSVSASDGDYIVIEIGLRKYSTASPSTAALRYGDSSANDLTTDGETNDYNPWVEFSDNLTFKATGGGGGGGSDNSLMMMGVGT